MQNNTVGRGASCYPSAAMVYSPMQTWGELFEPDVALWRGTLFPELDKPFMRGAGNDEREERGRD